VHELFATREPAAQDPAARPTSPTPSLTSTTMAPDTDRRENQREKRHRPIRAQTLNPDKSHGRPKDKHGLEAHRRKRPTRLRSPKKAPVPDDRTLGPDPDGPSKTHFHAATSRSPSRRPARSLCCADRSRCARVLCHEDDVGSEALADEKQVPSFRSVDLGPRQSAARWRRVRGAPLVNLRVVRRREWGRELASR
jgi:hypothetical protein